MPVAVPVGPEGISLLVAAFPFRAAGAGLARGAGGGAGVGGACPPLRVDGARGGAGRRSVCAHFRAFAQGRRHGAGARLRGTEVPRAVAHLSASGRRGDRCAAAQVVRTGRAGRLHAVTGRGAGNVAIREPGPVPTRVASGRRVLAHVSPVPGAAVAGPAVPPGGRSAPQRPAAWLVGCVDVRHGTRSARRDRMHRGPTLGLFDFGHEIRAFQCSASRHRRLVRSAALHMSQVPWRRRLGRVPGEHWCRASGWAQRCDRSAGKSVTSSTKPAFPNEQAQFFVVAMVKEYECTECTVNRRPAEGPAMQ